MRTDVEAARPSSDGADVSRRKRSAGRLRALQLPQRPPVAALPRRGPGRTGRHRRRRWTAPGGSAVRVADEPIGFA
jgi:hypothetical protein